MPALNVDDLKLFLDEKVALYNRPGFIESDPIQIPHRYTRKEDIEISGFLTAAIAWGNRRSILKSASDIMQAMDHAPYHFVKNYSPQDLEAIQNCGHRTFKAEDFAYFIKSLQNLYERYGGLETVFTALAQSGSLQEGISAFKRLFFELPHPQRTAKHISDPAQGSAAKRINLFLRWMVRRDKAGVDFGIWKNIVPAQLSCPLDVHSGNVARKLGLLKRTQNDAKAVAELDAALRRLDPDDPVKYDYALFGLGVFEGF